MVFSKKYWLTAALVFAASTMGWVASPEPVQPKVGGAAPAEWAFPAIQRRDPAKWTATLRNHSLWGVEAGAESAEAASVAAGAGTGTAGPAQWSIVGTVIEGQTAWVLISLGDQPSKPYRVGDSVPNVGKILRIEEDRLHLLADEAESVLEIYRK